MTDLSPAPQDPRLCPLPGCQIPIRRKGKVYCTASHKTKAWQLRKAQKIAEAKRLRTEARKRKGSWVSQDPLSLLDYLPIADRRQLFLEAAVRALRPPRRRP